MPKIKPGLKKIKQEVIGCRKCLLRKTRTLPVVGQGNHWAKIIFIGEAPGFNEDKTGVPFCGDAGRVLDELLKSINLKREEVYICNVVKCRPPQNRDPLEEEINACVPYLEGQIKVIKPKIICPMGNHAVSFVLKKFGLGDKIQGISKLRGKVFEKSELKIIPLYHPAVAVYNKNMKEVLMKDFRILAKGL